MKRFFAIVLAMVLCTLTFAVYAEETAGEPDVQVFVEVVDENGRVARSDSFFMSYGVGFSTKGNGLFHINFTVSAVTTMAKLGVSSYDVYKNTGSGWVRDASGLSGSYGTNTAVHTFAKSYQGTPGAQYYVYVRFYAQRSDGVGKTIYYSSAGITAN